MALVLLAVAAMCCSFGVAAVDVAGVGVAAVGVAAVDVAAVGIEAASVRAIVSAGVGGVRGEVLRLLD